MEAKNLVARAIENDKVRLDAGCKALLGCKSIAAFVVQKCIPEFQSMSYDEIMDCIIGDPIIGEHPVDDLPEKLNQKNSESKSVNDGTIYYDVLFDIRLPGSNNAVKVIIDIEAQNNFHPGYVVVARAVYYCARMLSEQKETVFYNSDYDKLEKIYSIWLCTSPDAAARGAFNVYEIQEKCLANEYHFPKESYDKLCIVVAGLDDKQSENELIQMFSYIFDDKETKEAKLDAVRRCGISLTKDIKGGISDMCSYSDYVEQQGIQKGIKQGIEQGVELGVEKNRVESVVNLVSSGSFDIDSALDILKVPADVRYTVIQMVEQKLCAEKG